MGYHIQRINHRWITKRDGMTVGIHKTQQQAIEAGKKRAIKDNCSVSWEDEEGNPQGESDYEI